MHQLHMFSIPRMPLHKYMIVILLLSIGACSTPKSKPPAETPINTTGLNSQLDLHICPKMFVSNKPKLASLNRTNLACINGVELQVSPAPKACLSSGFGKRGERQHRGIDYQSKPAGPVVAASNGKVVKAEYRKKDYGNWVVIDHGTGVYSSYAHLANFGDGIVVGASVRKGQTLGKMGSSGISTDAIHLHYEIRQGDINNPKNWWGMKAINPFKLPVVCN